jgi:hypothetical protein
MLLSAANQAVESRSWCRIFFLTLLDDLSFLPTTRIYQSSVWICLESIRAGTVTTRRRGCVLKTPYTSITSSFCLLSTVLLLSQVLLEFKEYATEVDVDFVRKAVRAIGRCAIKLERAAERCINVLLDLIKIKVNYVVQEAIIVIKDIFRRYPNT